jgi:hypothetical protein
MIALIAPYSLVVSLLYLFGFWGTFNINVLEYIALTDVIKNALYPLIYSSILIVLGLTIGNLISVPLTKIMPPGGGKDLPEAKFIRWFLILMALFVLGLALHLILFEVGNARWFKVAVLVSPILIGMVGNAEFASSYINNKHLRSLIVSTLCLTLFYSYGWGAVHAERAKISEQMLKINGKLSNQKYLGWVGGFLFLWDNSKNAVVVKSKSTIQSMELSIPNKTAIIDFSSTEKKTNKAIK